MQVTTAVTDSYKLGKIATAGLRMMILVHSTTTVIIQHRNDSFGLMEAEDYRVQGERSYHISFQQKGKG